MVQITSTLVAAAIIIPAFAAPVIESREPRITSAQVKSIAKGAGAIAKTAKSGIEFGAAVAPLFPHKQRREVEDLEVREPKFRISSSTLKHAGHAVAGAAGFAGTVAALNTQQQRDFEDELDARHFSFGKVFKTVGKVASNFIREDEMDLPEREFDDAELDAREPKFRVSASTLKHAGHAIAGAAGFAGTVAALNTQQQRDFEDSELDARDPKFSFGKVFKTVGKVASNFIREDEMDLPERDFEESELDARHFNIGKVFKTVGKVASNFIREDEMDLPERDFDESELDARHFNIGKVFKTVGKVASNFIREDEMDLPERDLDESELDARHFNIGKVFKTVGKVASNFIREDEMDLPERDFDESELDARHFNIGKVFKTVGKVASNFIREDELDLPERDLEESELDARRFNIGKVFKTVGKVASNFIRDEETGDIYVIREATEIDDLD